MIDHQSRNEIEFEWEAIHDDGGIVKQYDDNTEFHFGYIDLNTVNKFILKSKTLRPQVTLSLDLLTGEFKHNGKIFDVVKRPEGRGKLIFYRRYFRSFTPGSPVQDVDIEYHVGWESNGTKIMVILMSNGMIKLAPEQGFKPLV